MTRQLHPQPHAEHASPAPSPPTATPHHHEGLSWHVAAAVGGLVLLGFWIFAYRVLPDELPAWWQRVLALANALLVLVVFLLATHRSHRRNLQEVAERFKRAHHPDLNHPQPEAPKPPPTRAITLPLLGETSLRAVSGAVIFLLALVWWLTPWGPALVRAQELEDLAAAMGSEIETVVLMLADTQLVVPHPPVRPPMAAILASAISVDSGTFLLGQKATAEGRYDDARALLNRALATDSAKPAEISLALGQNELFAGRFTDAASQYDQFLQSNPTNPRLWAQAAVAWLHAGNYARAQELATKAVEMAEKAPQAASDPSVRGLRTLCGHVQAAVSICCGDHLERAEQRNKEVQDTWKELFGENTAFAASLNNQSVLFQLLGKYPGAQNNHNFAYSTWMKSLGARHPYIAVSRSNLAFLHLTQGRYSEAQRIADQVLRLRSEILPPNHPAQAQARNLSALVDLANGDYASGLTKARRAMEVLEATFSPLHPQVASVARSLGGLYQGLARYRKAEYFFYRMAEISQRTLGNAHPYLASGLYHLGSLYVVEGRFNEAQNRAEFALKIDERTFGEDHPMVARDLYLLAEAKAQLKTPTKPSQAAQALLERTLKIQQATLLEQHPDIIQTELALAALHMTADNYPEHVRLYERAIQADAPLLGEHHPVVGQFIYELARLHFQQGKLPEAETEVKRCLELRKLALAPYHPQLADAVDLYVEILRKKSPEATDQIDALVKQAAQIRSEYADVNAADTNPANNSGT